MSELPADHGPTDGPTAAPQWRVLIGSRSFGQIFPEHLVELERCRLRSGAKPGRPSAP